MIRRSQHAPSPERFSGPAVGEAAIDPTHNEGSSGVAVPSPNVSQKRKKLRANTTHDGRVTKSRKKKVIKRHQEDTPYIPPETRKPSGNAYRKASQSSHAVRQKPATRFRDGRSEDELPRTRGKKRKVEAVDVNNHGQESDDEYIHESDDKDDDEYRPRPKQKRRRVSAQKEGPKIRRWLCSAFGKECGVHFTRIADAKRHFRSSCKFKHEVTFSDLEPHIVAKVNITNLAPHIVSGDTGFYVPVYTREDALEILGPGSLYLCQAEGCTSFYKRQDALLRHQHEEHSIP